MDITNKEHSTCDKSPERIEKAIHALLALVCEDPLELPEAVLLGMRFHEDVSLSFIASAGDVTPLIIFPSVGFTNEAAPNKSLPTVVSANFFLGFDILTFFIISFFFPC